MATLTRAQIEAADDLPRTHIPVPEWAGDVYLRTMTAGEHARLGADYETLPKEDLVFYLLSRTLCDEAGALLFTGDGAAAALARKSKDVIFRLFEAASALNKITAADVEAEAKNSETSPSGGSSSGSPATGA